MKNIILSIAMAFAGVVLAAPSYWAAAYTEAATADKSGGTAVANYSGYYFSKAAAVSLFNGSDVAYLTDYFAGNLEASVLLIRTSMATGAGSVSELGVSLKEYDHGQYVLNSTYGDSLATYGRDFLALLLYSTDSVREFRVMSGDATEIANGNAYFNDDGFSSSGTSGAWTTVPEPTSGMLLLIGFASLALRRRISRLRGIVE